MLPGAEGSEMDSALRTTSTLSDPTDISTRPEQSCFAPMNMAVHACE